MIVNELQDSTYLHLGNFDKNHWIVKFIVIISTQSIC